MRILHISTTLGGGAGKAALRLHEALLDRDVDSHILCKDFGGVTTRNAHRIQFQPNLFQRLAHKLGSSYILEKNIRKTKGATHFYEFFSFASNDLDITPYPEFEKADIIHLHWVGNFFDWKRFFASHNKPVFWSLCDMNPFTGGCHYADGCDKYTDTCSSCPQLTGTENEQNAALNLSYKIKSLQAFKGKLYPVAAAHWMKNHMEKSTLFKRLHIEVIPHASDEKIYRPMDKQFCKSVFNVPENKILFLFLADNTDIKRKGFDLLLDALTFIGTERVHFLIVGHVSSKMKLPTEHFTQTGIIRDERLLALAYNAANAIIIPSREDNLPLTLIDSQMCGVPAIAFDTGGTAEHIIEGKNGFKAEEITAASLAGAIKKAISRLDEIRAEPIHQQAMEKFAKPVLAHHYLSLYKKVLDT
jgi:glycosyltransferase involved in cell wall biosynthesis